MLGRFVKVRVTRPIGFFDGSSKTQYRLNYGTVESGLEPHSPVKGAFIMGINHPVRNFDGRVIATVKIPKTKGVIIVVSPKSKRFIVNDVRDALAFMYKKGSYSIDCLYERFGVYDSGQNRKNGYNLYRLHKRYKNRYSAGGN